MTTCVPFCFLYRAPASRAITTSYTMTTTSLWMTCKLCPTSYVTCSHDATAVYPTLPQHTVPTWLPSGLATFCKTGRIRGEFQESTQLCICGKHDELGIKYTMFEPKLGTKMHQWSLSWSLASLVALRTILCSIPFGISTYITDSFYIWLRLGVQVSSA